jgi:hypothetical protein
MSKFFGGVKIPEWWVERAAFAAKQCNSTGAVHIGLVIWQQSNMRHRLDGLKLPVGLLAKARFGRSYVRTALEVLEGEGLIRLKRYRHKSPDITLVTSQAETVRQSTPGVDRIIQVASAVMDRDRHGRWVSSAPY